MKKDLPDSAAMDDHLGCLGEFRIEDELCNRGCAMRLRCAGEHNHNTRMEILEDLVSNEGIAFKIQ